MFNTLGRFKGLNDEMGFIVLHSLAEYPAWQAEAALSATAQQLVHVATGEGTNGWIGHTYGIIERYHPGAGRSRCARRSSSIGISISPRSTGSMFRSRWPRCWLVAILLGHGVWRRRLDDLTLLAGTVTLALLGNAFICGVISGPHDRYGARMVWVATFVVLIAAVTAFRRRRDAPTTSLPRVTENPARRSCRPCRRPRACGRGSECRAPPSPE